MKKLFVLVLAGWMLLIIWFSAQPAEQSKFVSGMVVKALVNMVTVLSPGAHSAKEQQILILQLHNLVRKVAHAVNFFVLGCLTYQAIRLNLRVRKEGWLVAGAIASCTMFAALDEFHQLYVPGRSCELLDVLIDSVSALVGIFVCWYITKRGRFGSRE